MATLPFLYGPRRKDRLVHLRAGARHAGRQRIDARAHRHQHGHLCGLHLRRRAGGHPGHAGHHLPGIILVILLAKALQRFHDNKYVLGAFYGLRPASTALIAAAGIGVLGESLFSPSLYEQTGATSRISFCVGPIILAAVLLFLTNFKPTKKLHPVIYIAASAAVRHRVQAGRCVTNTKIPSLAEGRDLFCLSRRNRRARARCRAGRRPSGLRGR